MPQNGQPPKKQHSKDKSDLFFSHIADTNNIRVENMPLKSNLTKKSRHPSNPRHIVEIRESTASQEK